MKTALERRCPRCLACGQPRSEHTDEEVRLGCKRLMVSFDGRCYHCGAPLGDYGADVRSGQTVVGYACRTCHRAEVAP